MFDISDLLAPGRVLRTSEVACASVFKHVAFCFGLVFASATRGTVHCKLVTEKWPLASRRLGQEGVEFPNAQRLF